MITAPRRTVRALAAAAILALVGSGAATATTAHDGPDFQRPHAGQCHRYGVKTTQSLSDGSRAVACSASHTALTIKVVSLPGKLSWDDAQTHSDAFYRALTKTLRPCAKAARAAFGADYQTIRATAYDWTFYQPTVDQITRGARWLRCDVFLYGGRALQHLPRGTNVRIGTIAPNEKGCRVWVSKTDTALTGCNAKHQYEVVKVIRVPGSKMPSQRQFQAVAEKQCKPLAGPVWWASWPGQFTWADGDHYLTCFGPPAG